ncbi:hypothetical protein B7463_g12294, partial [Scytalidium lignicola]
MADDSGTVVLPKDQRLKGSENYDLWSSCLMVLLRSKGLEDHVGNIVSPPKGDTPEWKAWRKDDVKTYICLNVNIDDKAMLLIKDYDIAECQRSAGRSEKPLTLTQLMEDITNESIFATSSSGTVIYSKNNSNSSNSKSSKDVKCNYYKKNSHKESNCFQKYPEKLEEYKAKQSSKKKEKKSEDKPKKSDSKDKSNTVNLNSASLVIANLVITNLTTFSMFTHNQWITNTSTTDHITNNLN